MATNEWAPISKAQTALNQVLLYNFHVPDLKQNNLLF